MNDPFSDAAMNPDNSFVPSRYLPTSMNTNLQIQKKFPKIERERQGMQVKQKTKNFIRSSTKLPNLKLQANFTSANERKNEDILISNQQNSKTNVLIDRTKTRQRSEGDQFTSQIQKKLKMVLDGHNNNAEQYEEASNSDEEFERKIHQNRQIIKKERMRRQALNQSACQQNSSQNIASVLRPALEKRRQQKNGSHQDLQKLTIGAQKNRNKDSMYERRVKDYRQQSIGNKFLIKKKQIIQKQQNSGKKIIQALQQHTNQNLYNFETIKNKSPVRVAPKKSINKILINATTKDEELFENLHNILLNPTRKSQNDIIKQKQKGKKKTRENLEEHLKLIEHRLTEQRKQDLDLLEKLQKNKKGESVNVRQDHQCIDPTVFTTANKDDIQNWRKIDASNSDLEAKRTNFEEEIQRVNKYFERSQRSLEKHVENQRRIFNLNLAKKKIQEEMMKIKV